MKLIDRHILAELTPTFFLAVTLFAGFIWVAAGPLLNAINYLAKGIPVGIVLQIAGLYLPPMLVLAFPMGMLIAAILGFTRLSSDSEAVAMFASGTSFYRMLIPVAVFAVGVTLLGLVVNNSIAPAASKRITYFKENVAHEFQQTTEPLDIPPLRGKNNVLQATIHVEGGFDARTRSLRKVTIVEFNAEGQPQAVIYASSAQWISGVNWIGHDGYIISKGIVAQFHNSFQLRDIRQSPDSVAFADQDLDDFSFSQLARYVALLQREGYGKTDNLREAQVELWDKIALPCASLVFALVGAPLALKPQRAASRGVAFGYGIGIILGYYALFKYLDILGMHGAVNPALAAFLPNLLGLILAGYLISRATT